MRITRAFCCALAVATITAGAPSLAEDQALSPKPGPPQSARAAGDFPNLSPAAHELAERLAVLATISSLQSKQEEFQRNKDNQSLLEIVALRQKLMASLQHASIEVEEAVAAIDGDLAFANMLLAYASSRRDRATMLNNVATFVASGAFGILDSSTDISVGLPTPQVLGIIGSSIATGLPVIGLRRREYQNPRRRQGQPNMLAPIFGRPFHAESYDPLVWSYIESEAAP